MGGGFGAFLSREASFYDTDLSVRFGEIFFPLSVLGAGLKVFIISLKRRRRRHRRPQSTLARRKACVCELISTISRFLATFYGCCANINASIYGAGCEHLGSLIRVIKFF